MTRRRKILWSLIALFTVLTIAREAGWVTVNWYNSNINATTTSNWTDNKGIADIPGRFEDSSTYTSCNYPSIADVPIQVWIDSYLVGDTVQCPQIGAFYHDITYGFLYTPMYKSAHFTATIPVSSSISSYTRHDTLTHWESTTLNGLISINGDINIAGVCSVRTARQIIREYVANEVYRQIYAHTHQ